MTGTGSGKGPDAGPGTGSASAATFTALTGFTGGALPYAGGNPYADYRAAAAARADLTGLVDLADRRLGAGVAAANDEFFAERENLLLRAPAVFDPERFGHKGKVMDGWETRRRRGPSADLPHPLPGDHDWALIRLGAPGVVRAVVVDTAHFRGNHPQAVSVDAVAADPAAAPEELLDPAVRWTGLIGHAPVGGHAENVFAVHHERRVTHLRLRQHPDGGVARLRVLGEVVPDPSWLAALGTFDLAALENGGRVLDASDRFYSPPENTLLPGRPQRMDEAWETRRRRDGGHDWICYRLAEQGEIRAVEIDTGYLKGNAAGWAELWVKNSPQDRDSPQDRESPQDRDSPQAADGDSTSWTRLLGRVRLQPDTVHRFLTPPTPATHARLDILPDGGVARLRLHGSLTGAGARRLAARHAALS
ncbi:allantoicase [Streptomyces sp. NPDC020983]|uniref:allantoicase n=1 Tax=Streptomyces sp. NPDC020983 TaxID=3365106 RepID=UPI0037A1F434